MSIILLCVGFRATRARAQKEKTSLSWEETLRHQSTRAFLRVPDPYVRHKEQMEYFDKRAYDFFRKLDRFFEGRAETGLRAPSYTLEYPCVFVGFTVMPYLAPPFQLFITFERKRFLRVSLRARYVPFQS